MSVKFLDPSWSNRGMDWFFLLNTEMEMFPSTAWKPSKHTNGA
ncbi:MAG TPA: hypothetical protein PK411_01060 [Mesotoga infera]|nr:hypothetical protein [Mesotoga infera]HON27102.1 hypothetical protein [Mesotoga infera]HPD36915.1 hypothetical protein [Mesotoga infera]HRV00091.1 hypothetical protein [Mesotoga sp.]